MSRMSFGLGVLILAALGTFVLGPAGVAQEERANPEQPFTNQFITVVKRSNPDSSIDLCKIRVQKLDGRAFLVGTGCDTPDNWQKDRTVWVALDDVSEITAFTSLEEMRKAGTLPDGPPGEVVPRKHGDR